MTLQFLRIIAAIALAGLGFWAYWARTAVSDEDLLLGFVTQICIPYVGQGVEPTSDDATLVDPLSLVASPDRLLRDATGAATLAEGRFEMVWGAVPGLASGQETVFCQIMLVGTDPLTDGFAIAVDGFVPRITVALQEFGLAPDAPDILPAPPTVVTWIDTVTQPAVTMVIGQAVVSMVIVARQPG